MSDEQAPGVRTSPSEGALRESRVLVLDNEPLNVRLLERILANAGYLNVVGMTDSSAATETFFSQESDLLLLDLHMPGLDGFQVLAAIRERLDPDTYLPVLVLTGDPDPELRRRALSAGAKDFVNKPFETDEVLLRIRNLLETRILHRRLRKYNEALEQRVRERTAALERAQHETLELLALASEYRDDETGRHTRRVGAFAALLAQELGLGQETVELVRLAAPLHDLGKIGIPDAVLLKDGPISPDERGLMQRHTSIGSSILSQSEFALLRVAGQIAGCHHEWWDGSGYPHGLREEEIPIVGRVVALADVYDSLIHARPYKEAWPVEHAVKEIVAYRGTQFDPRVVDAFLRLRDRQALPLADEVPGVPLRDGRGARTTALAPGGEGADRAVDTGGTQ